MPVQGHVIVGTAGHIDHGKTSLVRALTGVDTDRLKEEKERGITIELGFAPLLLPSGTRLGLVDVPGHERFVRNMVAGAAGIDLVLLVIAADEGVMPQTVEHLAICHLLGTRGGLVVLTKSDLVEKDWLEMVTEDIRKFLKGSFLEDAPILPFSSLTGEGKDGLLKALEGLAAGIPVRPSGGIFRLPVDRVFTMKGFGTVVTGTIISGAVSPGDEINFFPGQKPARVRGVQVHGGAVSEATAGVRAALNLQGVEKEAIERGDLASHAGALLPTYLLDARVRLLHGAPSPLKNRDRVRLHLYTAETLCRAVLLEGDLLEKGGEALVQLRLENPLTALPGDRFVLRSYSPVTTIGGGTVVDPFPVKHRRNRPGILSALRSLEDPDSLSRLSALLGSPGAYGLAADILAVRWGRPVKETARALSDMAKGGKAVLAGTGEGILAYSPSAYQALRKKLLEEARAFHRANPLKEGINREELRTRISPRFPDKAFKVLLADLEAKGEASLDREFVRVKEHQASLTPQQEALRGKLLSLLEAAGLTAPFLDELAETLRLPAPQVKAVLALLAQRGELVKVKDDYFVHPPAHAALMEKLEAYFSSKAELALADFRDLAGGATRKWMIPLLESLDRTGVTLRKGDVRIRRGKAPGQAPGRGEIPA